MNAAAAASSPPANARASRHRDAGRRGDLVAERLGGLEPRRRPRRAEDRDRRRRERVRDPGGQRRLGPDDDEVHLLVDRAGP